MLAGFKSEFTDWCRLLPRHAEPFVPSFVWFVYFVVNSAAGLRLRLVGQAFLQFFQADALGFGKKFGDQHKLQDHHHGKKTERHRS